MAGKVTAGMKVPKVAVGKADPLKARIAKKAEGAGGFGFDRTAGMLLDDAQQAAPYQSGYRMEAYRSSYAYGLGDRTGTYDVPMYFTMMNQQNGGRLYWPVTLAEKYQWYRYFARCIYLSDNDLGLVTMADGTVKDIRDVQIGDSVVTGLGTVRLVKDKFERRFADDKATTIKAWCLQNHLKTTHHHPYWILRGEKLRYANGGRFKNNIQFNPEWVHAEDVKPGDYVLLPPLPSSRAGEITNEQARVMCRYAVYDRTSGSGYDSGNKQIHISIPSWSANGLVSDSVLWDPVETKESAPGAFLINGYAAFQVKEVTFSQEDDIVHNIEVDAEGDEKSYICNGMVTHNTDAYVGRGLDLLSDLPMSKFTLHMPKMQDKEKQAEIKEFFENQMKVLHMFDLAQSILMEASMIGNCFKGDTPILTREGVVPISDIREGDMVLDADGNFSEVSGIARRKVSERLVSLGVSRLSGLEFSPTSEHPVFVLRDGQEKMVKAEEVHRGDWIGIGGIEKNVDIDKIDWFDEVLPSLRSFYSSVSVDDSGVVCEYETPSGINVSSKEVRESIVSWLSTLKEPVVKECSEVALMLGVSDGVRVRSAAYYLRQKGVIKTERTSLGYGGGSSMRWFPTDKRDEESVVDRTIRMESLVPRSIRIDEDFLYYLGYWLGDGWLWKNKNKFSREFIGLDICVSPLVPEFFNRINDIAVSLFGDEAVSSEKVIYDHMDHVVVRDPVFASWWNINFGSECGSKKIPGWVMELPKEKLVWLLRGLIDSDGCVSEKESGLTVGIAGTNKELMIQLFHISIKCGFPMTFSASKRMVDTSIGDQRVVGNKICFNVNIGTRGFVESLIHGCLKEKEATWSEVVEVNPTFKQVDGKFYYRVDEVDRPFYSGHVYNFEVKGSHTYCAAGIRTHNCFLFHEWDEEKKMWSKAIMLPPEEVGVFQYPFSDKKRVEYRPTRLIQLIKQQAGASDDTGSELPDGSCDRSDMNSEILDNIPQELVDMVVENDCIVMDSDPMTGSFVHHFARRKSPYLDLGASVLERVLVPMLQKEQYRYAQLSLASRNMTPRNVISAPGLMPSEVDELRTQIDMSMLDPDYSVVTNYQIEWNQIGAQDRLLDLSQEYERIENQVFAALGITRELMTGEGNFTGNRITVEIMNTTFVLTREMLRNYIEEQLFIPICEAHKWYEMGANGIKKYLHPTVGFNRITIRDNQEVFESLFQLYQKGSIPVDIIYELFNLNADEISEGLKKDMLTVKDANFNRLLEEISSEVGRNIVENSDVVERIAKYLGLKYAKPDEGDGGMGGGGGDESGYADGGSGEYQGGGGDWGLSEEADGTMSGDSGGDSQIESAAAAAIETLGDNPSDDEIDTAAEVAAEAVGRLRK